MRYTARFIYDRTIRFCQFPLATTHSPQRSSLFNSDIKTPAEKVFSGGLLMRKDAIHFHLASSRAQEGNKLLGKIIEDNHFLVRNGPDSGDVGEMIGFDRRQKPDRTTKLHFFQARNRS